MSDNLREILNSQVAKQAYTEGVSEPLKEVSGLTTDALKTLRLFMAPFQIAAIWQERLARKLDEVRRSVPERRQKDSPANIAGPAIANLRFIEDSDPLCAMYFNLLRCSIDRDREMDSHPAFIKVLEQISPAEIAVIEHLRQSKLRYIVQRDGQNLAVGIYRASFVPEGIATDDLCIVIDHLTRLGLIDVTSQREVPNDHHTVHLLNSARRDVAPHVYAALDASLSAFGRVFVRACCQ